MSKKRGERKQRQKQRQKEALAKRSQSIAAPQAPVRAIDPPLPERLRPPVYVDAQGHPIPDPFETLGIPRGTTDESTIRAAFREETIAHPPEQEPERARQIREARDRLIEAPRFLEREALELRVPDPDAWQLGETPKPRVDTWARLMGQAALYALVEDALSSEPATEVEGTPKPPSKPRGRAKAAKAKG